MLNFAEQTGSGAVMLVWSFPSDGNFIKFIYSFKEGPSSNLLDLQITTFWNLVPNKSILVH